MEPRFDIQLVRGTSVLHLLPLMPKRVHAWLLLRYPERRLERCVYA